jgi:peroxiredoxin
MNTSVIPALALAWLAILAGGWLGWQLLRQNGRLLLRLDDLEKRLNKLEFGDGEKPAGLPIGAEAPAFDLPDLAGERQSLRQYRGQPLLLIFFNPACGFCRDLAPKLIEKKESRKQETQMERTQPESGIGGRSEEPFLLIISTGAIEANRELFGQHQPTCPVLVQKEMEVASGYQVHGTPSGYLIDPDGIIASDLAMGGEALLELAHGKSELGKQKAEIDEKVSRAAESVAGNGDHRANRFVSRSLAHSRIKRDGLNTGTPAPNFRLPRLDGQGDFALEDLRGRRVLLVFSSPQCGPCNTLAPELQKFHLDEPEVEVVMISKGEPKENRAKIKAHGLTFPVVLQQQWEISRRYAMFATPIAYLIDEAGVIEQDVAVGTDAILTLLTRAKHLPGRVAEIVEP